jgi:hypothetical protein
MIITMLGAWGIIVCLVLCLFLSGVVFHKAKFDTIGSFGELALISLFVIFVVFTCLFIPILFFQHHFNHTLNTIVPCDIFRGKVDNHIVVKFNDEFGDKFFVVNDTDIYNASDDKIRVIQKTGETLLGSKKVMDTKAIVTE